MSDKIAVYTLPRIIYADLMNRVEAPARNVPFASPSFVQNRSDFVKSIHKSFSILSQCKYQFIRLSYYILIIEIRWKIFLSTAQERYFIIYYVFYLFNYMYNCKRREIIQVLVAVFFLSHIIFYKIIISYLHLQLLQYCYVNFVNRKVNISLRARY